MTVPYAKAVLLASLGLVGCKGAGSDTTPVETGSHTGDTVDTVDSSTDALIALGALRGPSGTLLWTDRALHDSERLERAEGEAWSSVDFEGLEAVDPAAGLSYRVVSAAGTVLAEADAVELSLVASLNTPLLGPQTLASLVVEMDGAESVVDAPVGEVSVGVSAEEQSRWFDPSCADPALPCWEHDTAQWAVVADALPTSFSLPIGSWLEEPGAPPVAVSLRDDAHDLVLATVELQLPQLARRLAWGDLHSHTNLSHDGCEDPSQTECPLIGDRPGARAFNQAELHGMEFTALTDHAEFDGYEYPPKGVIIDIWSETKALAVAADGGPVLPLIGYEWTGEYRGAGGTLIGGHRTVLLESLEACSAWRVPAVALAARKPLESEEEYRLTRADYAPKPADLAGALATAADQPGCEETRVVSYFHHSAYDPPAWVDWTAPENAAIDNVLIEIYSEHGSSECFDLEREGCDWQLNPELVGKEPFYHANGSAQAALALGFRVGFTGGTDNHEADPGAGLATGIPGHTATVTGPELAYAPGAVTGVLHPSEALSREQVFDALLERHTFASSWLFNGLRVAALGSDGQLYLPGANVPAAASPLQLLVAVDDETDGTRVQLLDPNDESWIDVESDQVAESFDLLDGDVRYVRVRVQLGDEEHRAWASPFFGVR